MSLFGAPPPAAIDIDVIDTKSMSNAQRRSIFAAVEPYLNVRNGAGNHLLTSRLSPGPLGGCSVTESTYIRVNPEYLKDYMFPPQSWTPAQQGEALVLVATEKRTEYVGTTTRSGSVVRRAVLVKEIVGVLTLHMPTPNEGHISVVCAKPGSGAGKLLVAAAERLCRQQGAIELTLDSLDYHVEQGDPNQAEASCQSRGAPGSFDLPGFYRTLGFKQTKHCGGSPFEEVASSPNADVNMSKCLKPEDDFSVDARLFALAKQAWTSLRDGLPRRQAAPLSAFFDSNGTSELLEPARRALESLSRGPLSEDTLAQGLTSDVLAIVKPENTFSLPRTLAIANNQTWLYNYPFFQAAQVRRFFEAHT